MALNPQKIPVVFRGLETKVDPRHQVVGDLTLLQNVRLDEYPKIRKRYGYDALVQAEAGSLLASYKAQLLVGTGSEGFAYTASHGALVDKGVMESLSLSVQPAARNTYTQQSPDMAVHPAGITVYAYESIEAGVTLSRYSVFDTATQQPIVSNALISTTASRPKTFILGNYVVIVYFDANHLRRIAIPVVSPASPFAAQDLALDPAPSPPVFDGQVIGGTLFVAYYNTAGKIAVTTLSPTLVGGAAAQLLTVASVTVVSIFSDAALNVWIAYSATISSGPPTSQIFAAKFTYTLAPVFAPVSVAVVVGLTHNITGIVPDTDASLFYDFSDTFPYIRAASVSSAGVATGRYVLRSVTLASKPFIYLNRVHFLANYQSTLQKTYFLLSGSIVEPTSPATVVGKVAPGVGGGMTARISLLPEANTVAPGVFSMAYLQTDRLTSVGGDVRTQTGVQGATWDFTVPQHSLELSDDLHVTGGILYMYDGAQVCEHGFHLFPETTTMAAAGPGSFTGSYQSFAVYEWMDNYGQIHQSAPSPVRTVVAASNGGFNYSVETLRLTAKQTPVSIAIYRTIANQTNFFRVTSISAPLLNNLLADSVSFSEGIPDATLTGNAQPYTNPENNLSEVPNLPAPAPLHISRYRNRAVVIPAENPFQWIFSKALVPGNPVEFNPQQLFQAVEQDGGALTCSIEMDDKLVLFAKDRLRYAVGDGPAPNGLNSDYSNAYHIPSDVGCANPRSLALIPAGVMFQSAKGIHLLGRDLSVTYIGAPVERFNSATVTAAKLEPNSKRVIFTLDTGIALAYDYLYGKWAVWTGHDAADAAVFMGRLAYVQPEGQVRQQTIGEYTDVGEPILIGMITSWLAFDGLSGVQRVWACNLRGDYRSPHILTVSVAVDDNPGTVHTSRIDALTVMGQQPTFDTTIFDTDNPDGGAFPPYEFEVKLARQRCASVQITIQEQQVGPVYGEGFSLSGITFLVGVDKGLHKVPASRSI